MKWYEKLKYVCHYLNMLVTGCLKVTMPSKPVFGGYLGTVRRPEIKPNQTCASISSKHRLLWHYHLIMCFIESVPKVESYVLGLSSRVTPPPLDKHLAAYGRGLQTVHINDNFTKLAEALYIADRKVHCLRRWPRKRKRRAGIKGHRGGGEDGEARERDEIRHDRRKERQHDRNISRASPDKRSKLQRDQDRDVNELIALGQPNPRASSEAQYDQRLFNQTKGMDSGFAGGTGRDMAQNIYRPTKSSDKDMYGDDLDKLMQSNRFVPDREPSTSRGSTRPSTSRGSTRPSTSRGSKRPSISRGSKDYDHDKKRRKE
uniref:SNW domain-containing protein 1 n=1 Tax=Oncorhynchus kisutch TaxID=8019 RepID=A0A8C7CZB0_ONCKI